MKVVFPRIDLSRPGNLMCIIEERRMLKMYVYLWGNESGSMPGHYRKFIESRNDERYSIADALREHP